MAIFSAPDISISIVSHKQIHLVKELLYDINKRCLNISLELILTLNLEEVLPFDVDAFSFPIKIIRNPMPFGFATNHNRAFKRTTGRFFCVMNPDIRIHDDPFSGLVSTLKSPLVGVVAPLVMDVDGNIEDSARIFPTPFKILCKIFGKGLGSDYEIKHELIYPDWIGGMFMVLPREIFEKLNGFNEQFFLYYEDVDLCARLRLLGYEVALYPAAKVIHDARRSSHKSFKYFKWHFASMLRFFCSMVFIKAYWQKLRR